MGRETFQKSVNIQNRKASFEYHFEEKFVTGIVLTGTEIKSIRQGKVTLSEAFCYFDDDNLVIKQMTIAQYGNGTYNNHPPDRERRLLLKKRELKRIHAGLEQKGFTLIPIRMFINDKGLAKMEIALAKGKKLYDKRNDIKDRDVKREMSREEY
ncbi:MAG: SsrA-binding protein SmpB [Bacteroidetes bacterium]|nr:MAG: SsrA-binding protein SmpB [Bacteroidota bacterium]